jgi:hypothetical protein
MFRLVFWDILPCKIIVDRCFTYKKLFCLPTNAKEWWFQLTQLHELALYFTLQDWHTFSEYEYEQRFLPEKASVMVQSFTLPWWELTVIWLWQASSVSWVHCQGKGYPGAIRWSIKSSRAISRQMNKRKHSFIHLMLLAAREEFIESYHCESFRSYKTWSIWTHKKLWILK